MTQIHPAFQHNYYLFRSKFWSLKEAFHIYNEREELLLCSTRKRLSLRKDFRIYADEHQTEELLSIKTAQILVARTYNVRDSTTGEPVGAIKWKFPPIVTKDRLIFLSNIGQEIGKLSADTWLSLAPKRYTVMSADGKIVAEIWEQPRGLLTGHSMAIPGTEPSIDRRLLIAAGLLVASTARRGASSGPG